MEDPPPLYDAARPTPLLARVLEKRHRGTTSPKRRKSRSGHHRSSPLPVLPSHRTAFQRCLEEVNGDVSALLQSLAQWLREEGRNEDIERILVAPDPRVKALHEAVRTMQIGQWRRASVALEDAPRGSFPSTPGSSDDENNRGAFTPDESSPSTEGVASHRNSPVIFSTIGEDDILGLRDALRSLGEELEKGFQEMNLLLQVTTAINSGLRLRDVLEHVWVNFRRIIPYNRIGFALLDTDDQGVEWVVAHWAKSDSNVIRLDEGFRQPLEQTSLGDVLRLRTPRILNDLEAYRIEHPRSKGTRAILREGGRSSLTCPLISEGKPVGLLFFTSFQTHTYRHVHCDTFMQLAAQLSTIVEKSNLYEKLLKEQQRGDKLLLNILPHTIAQRLKDGTPTIADHYTDVSIMFADLVGFTSLSSRIVPETVVDVLNRIYSDFDSTACQLGVLKVKTIGDSWMGAIGVPDPREDHAEIMAEMALTMMDRLNHIELPPALNDHHFSMRVGIACGPVVAGVIGKSTIAWDLWGDPVNTASRMESHSEPGKIQVTHTYRHLLELRCPGRFVFEDRGEVDVKGKGPMHTFYLVGRTPV